MAVAMSTAKVGMSIASGAPVLSSFTRSASNRVPSMHTSITCVCGRGVRGDVYNGQAGRGLQGTKGRAAGLMYRRARVITSDQN
eukprot:7004116-Pyramimonas_sp.AAC.2